jgi:outer membrane protein TolC
MKRNAIAYILVGALLAGAGSVSSGQQNDTPNETPHVGGTTKLAHSFTADSTVDDYLKYAFDHSPALKAANSTSRAADERANQSGYIDDPELSYEHMLEEHDMKYRIGISQTLPGFSKLRLKKEVAASRAKAAEDDAQAMKLMVFEHVIEAVYEYYYCGKAIAITEKNVALLTDLEAVILTRFKAKQAKYSDLLKVQVEKEKLEDQFASLKDMRPVASAHLAAWLDLPGNVILPWPKATISDSAALPTDVLMDMLEMLNPELRAIDARIEGLTSAATLAGRGRIPDFVVGIGYERMPDAADGSKPHDVGLMAGISIPLWWGKYSSAEKEAQHSKEAATHSRRRLESDLQLELKEALYDMRNAERKLKLLDKSLIPKARQALEVSKKEFENGEASFMTLIDAHRTLLDLSLNLERARADREIALGAIGCCVGKYDLKALGIDDNNRTDDKEERKK